MILPVPHPDSVVLETVHSTLFDECRSSVDHGRGGSRGEQLEVIEHGSYRVVLAKSLLDTDRVPSDFLTLSDDVKTFLSENYGSGPFGFLLCKLKAGATEYEPFAYSHKILEANRLFVPTKHFHVHRDASSSDASMADDWDHDVYGVRIVKTVFQSPGYWQPHYENNDISWSGLPEAFRYEASTQLQQFHREGKAPNEDLLFTLERSTEASVTAPPPIVEVADPPRGWRCGSCSLI
jgi:hypothetical protein